MSLTEAFKEFKEAKEDLKVIHADTVKCFEKIQSKFVDRQDAEILTELTTTITPGNPVADVACSLEGIHLNVDLADDLYTPDEKDEVQRLFSHHDPTPIIVGQTNCGKSSIINAILETKALPTSDTPCTARLVRLTYSDKPYMKLRAKDGTILEESELKKPRVPREKIELQEDDREDQNKVGASLVVGLNNDFLKAGVDIIDSPGKNENQVLDDLVKEHLQGVLPVVIYVVDGHNLFTTQDRTTLNDIMGQEKDLDIFYVVSKIDPEERTSSDEEEQEPEEPVTRVQDSKQQRVLEKLIKGGFIRAEDSSKRFHGLSTWKIDKWNELKKKNPNWNDPSYDEYIKGFDRFKSCFQDFCKASLNALIEKVSSVLIKVQSRCLDFFIKKANVLQKDNKTIMATLEKAKEEEQEVNEGIISELQSGHRDIADVIKGTIAEARGDVLQEAGMFEYDETILTELISSEGNVSDQAAVTECRSQIKLMVVTKLEAEVKEKMLQRFSTRDRFVKDLALRIRNLVEAIYTDEASPSTAARALEQSLVRCYKVNVKADKAAEGFIKRGLKIVIKFVRRLIGKKFPVGKPEWKREFASKVLDCVTPEEVTKNFIEGLRDHFIQCHTTFKREVEQMISLFERGETVKDQQRVKIRELAPEIAMLEMRTHSVVDKLRFGVPQKGDLIGSGGQGSVYTCPNITSSDSKACVVKIVHLSDARMMKNLSLELHNTRTLSHSNVLPLVCSMLWDRVQGYSVSLVSERMKSDLHEALPSITSLRARLLIALDVASGLRYLHKEDIIHRDVKPQNVLLDEHDQAKLTDLGLSKPEGLMADSCVGTVANMAPEMTKSYGRSVDVYAFGILLWRVCEGQGNEPKNLHRHPNPAEVLTRNAENPKTPERLRKFPDSCWKLMEKCWRAPPEKRPTFEEVIKDLEDILKDPRIK